ncbi:MAG TPA: UDP-3-O-(3-hydroxymyristoyl)glucosamine N-acyltransferase [Gemmatimonadaceae bacterium]|nr:UDP-3-O-(3-hydroxymyristoyl)glucosamine N-acyltransferase [Gemmatimonadaceae bacterium]
MSSSPESVTSGDGVSAITAGVVSDLVGGELRGDSGTIVSGVAPLYRAERTDVSFLASARYAGLAERSHPGVLLVSPELADTRSGAGAVIVVPKPHEAMLALLPQFHRTPARRPGVHPTARIGRGATVGEGVTLEEYAVIGAGASIADGVWMGPHSVVGDGVRVGRDSVLYAHCTLYSGTEIGQRVIVQSGARVGSDGFGYVFRDGQHARVPHVGRCIIGDDVDIGANTTIDRGSLDDTVIGAGTKIDNLVQIGHNVKVGRLCLLIAQVGISGSTHIEDGVVVAGQAGIGGHLTIGAGARIAGQSGVFGDVPAGESWSGYPARPHRESLRASAAVMRLSQIIRRLERLLEERGQ